MSETYEPITSAEVPGYVVGVGFAVLSATALSLLALRVIFLAVRDIFGRSQRTSAEFAFFHTNVGLYAACLLLSNFINSAGGALSIAFLVKRVTYEGSLCTTQGILMQIGNYATAYFIVALGLHTFISLVLRIGQRQWVTPTIIMGGLLSSLAIGLIPFAVKPAKGPIYGSVGLICFIRREYPELQFGIYLIPIFIATVLSAILFFVIFLVVRGIISVRDGISVNLDAETRSNRRSTAYEGHNHFMNAIARSMLWFPFAFVVLLLPFSIVLLLDMSGTIVHFRTNVFAFVCTFLLGIVNVCLMYHAHRVLGPAFLGMKGFTDVEASSSLKKTFFSDSDIRSDASSFTHKERKISFSALSAIAACDSSCSLPPGRYSLPVERQFSGSSMTLVSQSEQDLPSFPGPIVPREEFASSTFLRPSSGELSWQRSGGLTPPPRTPSPRLHISTQKGEWELVNPPEHSSQDLQSRVSLSAVSAQFSIQERQWSAPRSPTNLSFSPYRFSGHYSSGSPEGRSVQFNAG